MKYLCICLILLYKLLMEYGYFIMIYMKDVVDGVYYNDLRKVINY